MTYRSKLILSGMVCLALATIFLWDHQSNSPKPSATPTMATSPEANGSHEEAGHKHHHPPTLDASSGLAASSPIPSTPEAPAEKRLTQPGQKSTDPDREPAFARFEDWTRQYLQAGSNAERAQLLAEGMELARLRRSAMFSLIQTDSQRALALSLPLALRNQLPAEMDPHFEQLVSGRGDYEVLCVYPLPGLGAETTSLQHFARFKTSGQDYRAFKYGARDNHNTLRDIPMHGVAVDDVFALSENPVRLLEQPEIAALALDSSAPGQCAFSAHPMNEGDEVTPVDVGGEIQILCSHEHAEALNAQVMAFNGEGGGAETEFPVGIRNCSEGRKRLIIFRVAFTDIPVPHMSHEDGVDLIDRVNDWMTRVSYGRTTVAPVGEGSDVVQVTLANDTLYYEREGENNAGNMRSDAIRAAEANGVNMDLYDYNITATGSEPSFGWAGLGFVGGANCASGSWIRSGGGYGTGVTVHELGHNFGLPHGNYYNTGGESVIGPGDNNEYGDIYDVMGSGGSGSGDYCALFKNYIGWISDEDYPLITSSSRFRLFSHDNPDSTGMRGFQVTREGSTRYSVEFRQRFTDNQWIMNGLGLRWGSGRGSQLLDTTPGVGGRSGRTDSAIVLGRTYSDFDADVPVHITALRLGNTYPESMDVQVHLGTFPGNQAPSLDIQYESLDAPANTPLSLTAISLDPDGDELAYHWEFGNGDFGNNTATATYAWDSNGEYVVRCTVSDMKGGTTSKSVRVRIGAPSTFTISGRVMEDSQPLEGVLVQVSSSRYAYTDSDGTYTITGLGSGSYTVEANLFPFTLVHPWFDNPVNVGPNATSIDFITTESVVDDTVIVPEGSVWSYLDDGSDQGTAWRTPSFDDSSWASGAAQLGYGDDDEATVVSFGADSGNKYITTYFRHTFNVADPGSLTNLNLGFLRDDSGVVYLNGVEIKRDNLPTGTITYLTEAEGSIPGSDEDTFFQSAVDISLLNAGNNTLAAEIHQAGPTSSDISFDLRLTATTATNFQGLSLFYIASPANDQLFNPGANVPISVNAFNIGGSYTLMEFYGDGVKLGEDATEPFSLEWTAPSLGDHTITVVATANGGIMSTSQPVTFTMASSPFLDLVSFGGTWKYLDDGSDQGTAWQATVFDDSSWALGPAELGYGDGDEATVVGFGPDSSAKYPTTYFRKSFNVDDPSTIASLDLSLIRDDGAVVYINGGEVFRDNMPVGDPGYLTQASAGVSGGAESVALQTSLSPSVLQAGINVVAVEIHQNSGTSSDISFDLALDATAIVSTPMSVTLTSPADNSTFNAPAQISLEATATAETGFTISQVEFFEGSSSLGIDTTAPYGVSWSNVSPGTYTLTARLSQNNGSMLDSAPVAITVIAPPASDQLIPAGAVWSYLDNGAYPGPTWTELDYSDQLWLSGRARLGYGGDGETTVISFGTDPNGKHITTWFRHAFTADATSYDMLRLRLKRDDGAVVYLNGVEIRRDNMLSGEINPTSLAVASVGGSDETTFFETLVPGNLLNIGPNILAVEVHQQSLSSSDLGFDLELNGLVSTNLTEGVYLTQPGQNDSFNAGNSIQLAAYATAAAGISRVDFYDGPSKLGEDTTAPYDLSWSGAAEGSHTLTAQAITDTAQVLISAPVTVTVVPAPPTIIPIQATLIGPGSSWRYWDNGSKPAENWMDRTYSDSAWPLGASRMGFGLDGEQTELSSSITTAYFRRTFNASSPAAFGSLNIQFQRDDGIAIYLNGLEIFRNNLPGGPLDYDVTALSGVSGLDEQYFFEIDLSTSGSGIKRGSNLIAVEVHQIAGSQSDLGFDLQLQGRGSTEPRVYLARPITGSLFNLLETIAMEAFPSPGPANSIELVEFFVDGTKIGEKTSSPYDLTWSTDTAGTYSLTAHATDIMGRVMTSPPLEILVGFEEVPTTFVAQGSVWSYLDNGSDQGTAWRQPGFNDSSWVTGAAQLGYGDGDEATVVSFGPSSGNKYITTYFRHVFSLSSGSQARDLNLLLQRDDGAVVYLNGSEIVRDNMPSGFIDYLTTASGSISDENEFALTVLDPSLVLPGDNVLAVEIHQNGGGSSDISFDLELVGTALNPALAPPALTIRRISNTAIELAWPEEYTDWFLYTATSVDPGSTWQQIFAPVVVTNGENVVTVPSSSSIRFFRLQQ